MKYDFDRMVNRYGTDCYKWDMIIKRKLDPNTLPLWVADMDFETVPEVKERLKEVADRGIYGYSMLGDGYYDALKNWFSTPKRLTSSVAGTSLHTMVMSAFF